MTLFTRGQRGFTLIELLVVIAIIGILSSVVLASLNTARNKGNDAAIKTNLANIRPQAEIVYDALGCYGDAANSTTGACASGAVTAAACTTTAGNDTLFGEATVMQAISSAKSASGGSSGLAACASTANQAAWAVAVPYKTDASKAWCVDSTGVGKEVTTGSATAYTQTTLNGDISGALCGS